MLQLHNQRLYELEAQQRTLPNLQQQLLTLNADLQGTKDRGPRLAKEQQINELQEQIAAIKDNRDFNNYLLDSIPLLNMHYAVESEYEEKIRLAQEKQEESVKQQVETLQHELAKHKNNLLLAYKKQFMPQLLPKNQVVSASDNCDSCKQPLSRIQHELVCKQCAINYGVYSSDDVEFCSYERLQNLMPVHKFTYKRINHFREYLRQIQGETKSEIKPFVLDSLREEFKKYRRPVQDITPKLVRSTLKKLKLTKNTKYENTIAITAELNPHFVPLRIQSDHVETLVRMFCSTETVFDTIKHLVKRSRKNYMSYPFVAFKLCELKGYDNYLPHFILLKSYLLLVEHDRFWKLTCERLNWQYISTIGNVNASRPVKRCLSNQEIKPGLESSKKHKAEQHIETLATAP